MGYDTFSHDYFLLIIHMKRDVKLLPAADPLINLLQLQKCQDDEYFVVLWKNCHFGHRNHLFMKEFQQEYLLCYFFKSYHICHLIFPTEILIRMKILTVSV